MSAPIPALDELIRDAVLLIRTMKADGTRFLSEDEAAQIIKRICEISRLQGQRLGFSAGINLTGAAHQSPTEANSGKKE